MCFEDDDRDRRGPADATALSGVCGGNAPSCRGFRSQEPRFAEEPMTERYGRTAIPDVAFHFVLPVVGAGLGLLPPCRKDRLS
jgi:hypothetical protein